MKLGSTKFFGLMGLTMLASSACNSESEKSYSATVGWTIANQQICQTTVQAPGSTVPEQVTIDHVLITVYEDENYKEGANIDEARIAQSGEVSCDDREYVFEDLPRGKHWATVWAYAQREDDSEPFPYFQAEGELAVPAEDDEVAYFNLNIGEGDITVTWDFEQFGDKCGEEATVSLTVEAGSPKNEYSSEEPVDCTAQNIVVAGQSWDTYQVKLEAFDADGVLTHRGTCVDDAGEDIEEFELHPGEAYDCIVALREI